MAKNFDAADDVGKPGKPPKYRKFPWRLWLWALVMTAAAGAGGFFTYHYYKEAQTAHADTKTALDEKTAAQESVKGEKALVLAAAAKTCDDERAKIITECDAVKAQQATLMKDRDATKEALGIAEVQIAQNCERLKAIDQMQDQFKNMIDSGAINVTSRRGGLVLSLPAEVLFPSGVADLSEEGKIKVQKIGFILEERFFNVEKLKDRRFLVVGHSDNQPLKNSIYKDNWELSAARALTVTRHLVHAGGVKAKNLIAAGAGDHDPVVPHATSVKDLARNRRIEIALLPEIPTQLGDAATTDKKPTCAAEPTDPKKPTDAKPVDPKKPEPKPEPKK